MLQHYDILNLLCVLRVLQSEWLAGSAKAGRAGQGLSSQLLSCWSDQGNR